MLDRLALTFLEKTEIFSLGYAILESPFLACVSVIVKCVTQVA